MFVFILISYVAITIIIFIWMLKCYCIRIKCEKADISKRVLVTRRIRVFTKQILKHLKKLKILNEKINGSEDYKKNLEYLNKVKGLNKLRNGDFLEIVMPVGGKNEVFDIPKENIVGVIMPDYKPGLSNVEEKIKDAVHNPIGSKKLSEIVKEQFGKKGRRGGPYHKVAIVAIDAREFQRLDYALDTASRNIKLEKHDYQERYAYRHTPWRN